jgi:hypothetical protein
MKEDPWVQRGVPALLWLSLLLACFVLPHAGFDFYLWLANDAQPETLTLEEYLQRGSKQRWVVLRDCYVAWADYDPFFPLKTSPNDNKPPRVFVRPDMDRMGDLHVMEPVREPPPRNWRPSQPVAAQVSGILAFGNLLDRFRYSDVREILQRKGIKGAVLVHHQHPPQGRELLVTLLVLLAPLAPATAAIFIFLRGNQLAVREWGRRLAGHRRAAASLVLAASGAIYFAIKLVKAVDAISDTQQRIDFYASPADVPMFLFPQIDELTRNRNWDAVMLSVFASIMLVSFLIVLRGKKGTASQQ